MTTTNLLAKYLALYEKDPQGLAFAPLAECYRKLGLLPNAYEILKQGIRQHPHYLLGQIVLAHCYIDDQKLSLAYKILTSWAQGHTDNLKLQSLYAKVCYALFHYDEALQSYKNVLFLNPQDQEAQARVEELENDARNSYAYLHQSGPIPHQSHTPDQSPGEWDYLGPDRPASANLRPLSAPSFEQVSDGWEMRSLTQVPIAPVTETTERLSAMMMPEVIMEDLVEQTMEFSDEPGTEPEVPSIPIMEQPEEQPAVVMNQIAEHYQHFEPHEEIPIVTHTLIDLYYGQKHYDKAIELLQKVIRSNPKDEKSKEKMQRILEEMAQTVKKDIQPQKQHPTTLKSPVHRSEQATRSSFDLAQYQLLASRYKKFLSALEERSKA